MLFHTDLGRGDQPVGNGEQPRLSIAVTAAIDGNGFQAKVKRSRW